MPWYVWFILIVIALLVIGYFSHKAKRERLMKIYKDEALVDRLMNGEYWKGQTKSQLRDSLGRPEDTTETVLKTKRKETWKYQKVATNRYKLKIFIEDSVVVGWDKK